MTDRAAAVGRLTVAMQAGIDWLEGTLPVAPAKSVNEVTRAYTNTLTRFCFEVLRGGDAVDFRRSHKSLIRSLAPQVYGEGLREGGVDPDEMDDDDRAAVRDWVGGQVAYVNNFAAWLASGDPRNSDDKRREMRGRVEMWVGALDNLGGLGRASAKENLMVEFVGEDGDESCDECREHKGQKHRVKWWVSKGLVPGVIGNKNYECGGFNCQHFLADKEGNRVLP